MLFETVNDMKIDKLFLEKEIIRWLQSDKRKKQIQAECYYKNKHDILKRKREAIGADGALIEVTNLPNNRLVDNQYSKMVDQKTNYLLGKPLTFDTENQNYANALKEVFTRAFHRTFKALGDAAVQGGIAWLMPYYDTNGSLAFKRFEPHEILPLWEDAEHTKAQACIRFFDIECYENNTLKIVQKVEVYTQSGVQRFDWVKNHLKEDTNALVEPYLVTQDGKPYNWERLPLIPWKYNAREITVLERVKPLQDGLNLIISDFQNNLQEDPRNTILVLENYDGENLGEFRRNLATYGAVKVKSVDGVRGGVSTLEIKINANNYEAIHSIFKKALIENARGYDAKDERLMGAPNQMNIQSIYSDIDLDANGLETEFQASFEELLWFVKTYLKNKGVGNFENEVVDVIFNRDVLINESEAVDNCKNSMGVLSHETIVGQHPWTMDIAEEMKRIKTEQESEQTAYDEAFAHEHMQQNKDNAAISEAT